MIADKELLNKLNESGSDLLSTEPTFFAAGLSNFIDEIDNHKLAEVFDSYSVEQETNDKKLLHKLEQELQEELIAQNNLVEEYYGTRGIPLCKSHMPLPQHPDLSEFRAYEQNLLMVSDEIGALIEAHSSSLSHLMHIEIQKSEETILTFIKDYKRRIAIIGKHEQIIGLKKGLSEKELCSIHLDIITFINNTRILYVRSELCSSLTEQVEKYCHHEKKDDHHDIRCFYGIVIGILSMLSNSLHVLKTTHHRSFVEQFATLDNQGQIKSLKIDSLIMQRNNEKKRLDRLAPNTFWHAWNQLKWFYNTYKNFEHMQQEAFDNKDYLLEYGVYELFKKIEGIAATNSHNEYENELKGYLKITLKKVDTIANDEQRVTSIDSKKDSSLVLKGYDATSQKIAIGKHTIHFPKKRGRPNIILPEICTVQMKDLDPSTPIKWPWRTIYTKILAKNIPSGSTKKNDIRRSLYESYKHINEEIEKQSDGEIKQFLIYDMDDMHINPKYL